MASYRKGVRALPDVVVGMLADTQWEAESAERVEAYRRILGAAALVIAIGAAGRLVVVRARKRREGVEVGNGLYFRPGLMPAF